ncbi:hypothetical protein STENM327S_06297 [Streptomyces tendae]
MDLYEHQARELFKEHGVVVPRAEVTDSPGRAREIARALGGRAVVKAQVKTGGRGKAGGVRLAADPAEAEEAARQILGMDIKGHTVDTVMVAEPCDIEREFYVSYLLDRARGGFLAIASAEGGMEIEEVAATAARGRGHASPSTPPTGVHAATAVRDRGRRGTAPAPDRRHPGAAVEGPGPRGCPPGRGQPAGQDRRGQDRRPRRQGHPRRQRPVPAVPTSRRAAPAAGDTLEARAGAKGLNYVKLDGEVGVIGNGAGLVMSTLDVVAAAAAPGLPADFLDIGGGASARVMADGLSVILSDPDVKSVLVNVFGGITACDAVADGIVRALDEVRLTKPLVVRLDGNNAARGRALLDARAHPLVEQATTMDGAARRAADSPPRRPPPDKETGRHGDLPHQGEQGPRPGHDRCRGHEAHPRHAGRAAPTSSGGVNPRKAGRTVDFEDRAVPVFGAVREGIESTGADVTVVFVPPAFAKAAVVEAADAGIGLAVVITEGIPVHDAVAFTAHARAKRARRVRYASTARWSPPCPRTTRRMHRLGAADPRVQGRPRCTALPRDSRRAVRRTRGVLARRLRGR